jgi:hypothetical protein
MQLGLDLFAPPRTGDELLARLRALGLRRVEVCRLTRNRRTMVSFHGPKLRIHEGYLGAPEPVLAAVVSLVQARTRRERAVARRTVLAFPIEVTAASSRRERPHPDDDGLASRLAAAHAELNQRHFAGALGNVAIRVSRRMKRRLGHYCPAGDSGPAEIAISRRHIRRHGWREAIETLLHEMVHQWQVENGHPLDHGRAFRRKARDVGIAPRASRLQP